MTPHQDRPDSDHPKAIEKDCAQTTHDIIQSRLITDKKSLFKSLLTLSEKMPIRQDSFVFFGFPENSRG
jgi:hypothetical protein